ncbi:putative Brix domain-containing protein [Helianthus anomalus]
MLRRNVRLRREYLYRKSLEGKERLLYEKKRKIKQALEEGKPIPTELRNEDAALRQEIDLEDERTAVPRSTIDDEYANATERDPKILLTTSHDPSAPLKQFVKELKFVFPNSQRMNRGGQVISEIVETCRSHDFTDLILVHEHRGVPDNIIISHLPYGPTAYFQILNVVTRHDNKDKKEMGTVSEAYPHLILNNFSTKMGERTATILKHLFPVPKPDSKRIITFANQSDYISFRSTIDDEYANATERDPKILLTTSHDPSAPLKQFVKELKFVFPNSQRMNRGGQVISEIVETCRSHDFTDLILVHEHRGVPDNIIISHLPYGPTAYFQILNVVTRHDNKDKKEMGTVSEAYPHLILNNFSTKMGERTATILKHLFPVPKPDSKRIITFANQSDYISFRHHVYRQSGGPKSIDLKEVGPRFELRLYQVKLGTVDQLEAQNEWVLPSFMNTSKKQKILGE